VEKNQIFCVACWFTWAQDIHVADLLLKGGPM